MKVRGFRIRSKRLDFRIERVNQRQVVRLVVNSTTRPKVIAFNVSRYEPRKGSK